MERWAAKVISLFVIFFVVFAITLLPIKVYGIVARYGARGVHLISCLMCFGGGVFLGVYMLHMAPDVRNIFDEAIMHPRRITYPIADCVMVGGFFMMLFFESLIKHIRSITDGDETQDGNVLDGGATNNFVREKDRQNKVEHDVTNNNYRVVQEMNEHKLLLTTTLSEVLTMNDSTFSGIYSAPSASQGHSESSPTGSVFTPLGVSSSRTSPVIISPYNTTGNHSVPSTVNFNSAPSSPNIYFAPATPRTGSYCDRRASVFGYELQGGVRLDLRSDSIEVCGRSPCPPADGQRYQTISKSTTAGREYSHIELLPQTAGEASDCSRNYHINMTRSMTLLFALSLHNVFEGLSIGLKQTVSSVLNLSIAVLAHEVVIAFSLGMQMVKTYRSVRKIVLAAAMCSSMVPLGMLIGLGIMETRQLGHYESSLTANGVLQGLATGVFIYVTFFEILRGELGHGKAGIDQMLFMLFGFVVLALLAMIPDDKGAAWNHHHVYDHDIIMAGDAVQTEQPGESTTAIVVHDCRNFNFSNC